MVKVMEGVFITPIYHQIPSCSTEDLNPSPNQSRPTEQMDIGQVFLLFMCIRSDDLFGCSFADLFPNAVPVGIRMHSL